MRAYQRTYRNAETGKRQKIGNYYVDFYDAKHGLVRTCPGYADKAATEALGRTLEKLAARAVERAELDDDLRQWLDSQPTKMHKRLYKWALIDSHRAAARKALSEHLADYTAALKGRGVSSFQAEQSTKRTQRLFELADCHYWSDITPGRIEKALGALVVNNRPAKTQTKNHYLTCIKAFCNWMVQDQRAMRSPIEHLRRQPVTDNRERRAVRVEEMLALIAAAEAGDDWEWGGGKRATNHPKRISGPERALLYRLAVETGLRRNELASLTRASFKLDESNPSVRVESGRAKNRKVAVQPLRPATAKLLEQHLQTKMPTAPAFTVPQDTARMIRADMAAARQAWLQEASDPEERLKREQADLLLPEDHAGKVVDFHALRHTTGSWLAESGAHPKVVQQILRHSTITLTMDRYSHLFEGAESEAVNKLPGLGGPEPEAQPATGTTGDSDFPPNCAQPGDFDRHIARHNVKMAGSEADGGERGHCVAGNVTPTMAALTNVETSRWGGRAADCTGLENRRGARPLRGFESHPHRFPRRHACPSSPRAAHRAAPRAWRCDRRPALRRASQATQVATNRATDCRNAYQLTRVRA